MKKTILLLLTLLLVLSMVVGCSQNNNQTEEPATQTTETTTDANEKGEEKTEKEKEEAVSEIFGIPQETNAYHLRDLTDTEDPYTQYLLEEEVDDVFGIEGFRLTGDGEEGSHFLIYAEENEAFIFKSIENVLGDFKIVLQKAEPGTQYAQNVAYVGIKEPFKSYRIEFEDGTALRNIDIFAGETILTKDKGIFQSVNGEELTIIPDGATIPYTFGLEDVPENAFDDIQEGETIELMRGKLSKKVYSVRKMAE